MSQIDNIVKGIVIRESLRDGELPGKLLPFVATRYQHSLAGIREVEILVLRINAQMLSDAATILAESLLPKGYYAHFVETLPTEFLAPQGFLDYFVLPDRLWIVFPRSVVIAHWGDSEAFQRCRILGRGFDIPDDQMPFEALFDKDHPHAH